MRCAHDFLFINQRSMCYAGYSTTLILSCKNLLIAALQKLSKLLLRPNSGSNEVGSNFSHSSRTLIVRFSGKLFDDFDGEAMQIAPRPLAIFLAAALLAATAATCTLFRYQVVVTEPGPLGTMRYDRWTGKVEYLLPYCHNGKVIWPMRWGQPDDPDVARFGCPPSNPFEQFSQPKSK